jgi:thymidine phosphorylase
MASEISEIAAGKSGFITEISARQCAEVAGDLGAGRKDIDDDIKPSVGLQFNLVVGDEIIRDQTWVSVHHEDPLKSEHLDKLRAAIKIGSTAKEPIQRLISTLE